MPNQLRITDEPHYYHIMSRGANKQQIFHDTSDYKNFINLMRIYSNQYPVNLLNYCLMPNHFHILLYDEKNNMSKFMKCLKQLYSVSYNNKYERIGPLFNDRFKAKIINNEQYLYIVFRYILLNPEKAGICDFRKYLWSGYKEMQSKHSFLSTSLISEILGNPQIICKTIEFSNEDYLSYSVDPIKDYEIKKGLKDKFGLINVGLISKCDFELRDQVLYYLRDQGMSIVTISKITNMSVNYLYKFYKK